MPNLTPELARWASPTQKLYLDTILAHDGKLKPAARSLNRAHATVQESMKSLLKKAATHGYSPDHGMTRIVPEPFVVKGQSTLDRIDPLTGQREQVLQWTKTKLDDEAWVEQIKQGIAAFVADQPDIVVPEGPQSTDIVERDIIPWINIGDAHFGMLAHEAETGANFDLKIAEEELLTAIYMLIDELPACERLVINDLGDFTHYENMAGVTEASGHALDFDGRFPKMIELYSKVMRLIVDRALTKAENVDIIINQGNHSRTNDIWMATLLRDKYEGTGRVNVLNNHGLFIGYRMGNTFVMTHHSDKAKPARLADIMSNDFAVDWGESTYRYIDIGHIHHGMVMKEHPGVSIESFNTLAAKDKWTNDNGYRSRQSISMIFRSRTYGEVGRRILSVDAVRDRIAIRRAKNGKPPAYRPGIKRAFAV